MATFGQRFLVIYSGVLTTLFAVLVLCGFVRSPQKLSLQELDVQRINLREPDGTLRMVISDASTAPGIIIKGKEYPHPDRHAAGMIFYNDEGTENGGLIFGGEKNQDGSKESHGHLSFDAYEQDQTVTLDSSQEGSERYSRLQFNDYPDYSILELLKLQASIKDLLPEQQQEKIAAFFKTRGGPTPRLVLGRGMGHDANDDSVMLRLNDTQGNARMVMKVASDGQPSLQMFDNHGKVIGELVAKPQLP